MVTCSICFEATREVGEIDSCFHRYDITVAICSYAFEPGLSACTHTREFRLHLLPRPRQSSLSPARGPTSVQMT